MNKPELPSDESEEEHISLQDLIKFDPNLTFNFDKYMHDHSEYCRNKRIFKAAQAYTITKFSDHLITCTQLLADKMVQEDGFSLGAMGITLIDMITDDQHNFESRSQLIESLILYLFQSYGYYLELAKTPTSIIHNKIDLMAKTLQKEIPRLALISKIALEDCGKENCKKCVAYKDKANCVKLVQKEAFDDQSFMFKTIDPDLLIDLRNQIEAHFPGRIIIGPDFHMMAMEKPLNQIETEELMQLVRNVANIHLKRRGIKGQVSVESTKLSVGDLKRILEKGK